MFNFRQKLSLKSAQQSLLSSKHLTSQEKNWLQNIQTRIHKQEKSYLRNNDEHYLSVGLSAVNCIQKAIRHSNLESPTSILDFPSGYGRVLRFIEVAFPEAYIEAMELDSKAVQFCRKIFGVGSSLSRKDFSKLRLKRTYDLIWCGSLVTHLDKLQTENLLSFFFTHLNPGGLCVFTTHGVAVETILETGEQNYSLNPTQIKSLIAQYQKDGFGFTEYEPSRDGYGFSLTEEAIIRQIAEKVGQWSCNLHIPNGWDNHQDVYSFSKHT
ncbi:MAG: class I SAM-dependent methyltransferase [Verrucomicrobia bacterium]|nr:class I SAM-dependent methyltransferase [Verrucomicrobiota bacterium]